MYGTTSFLIIVFTSLSHSHHVTTHDTHIFICELKNFIPNPRRQGTLRNTFNLNATEQQQSGKQNRETVASLVHNSFFLHCHGIMPRTEQQSLRQRSNINTECTEISKPDMMDCRISDVDGMKVLYPSDFGCGVEFLPPFLLRLFRRRKVMKNEKYYMDATTSQFFHGSVTTSDSAAPSSGSSSTGEGSSCGSNCDDHDVPLDSNDCDSFARGCTVSVSFQLCP